MATFDDMDKRLEQLPAVMATQLHRAMTASLLLIESDARHNAAYDTGRLAGGITSQITGEGLSIQGRVGPSARYGVVVEFGRRAGAKAPPVDALMGWVQRHPRGRGSLRSQAFVLARAIKRRGIRPRPFLVPAYHKNLPAIRALFDQAGARVVASLRGNAL